MQFGEDEKESTYLIMTVQLDSDGFTYLLNLYPAFI